MIVNIHFCLKTFVSMYIYIFIYVCVMKILPHLMSLPCRHKITSICDVKQALLFVRVIFCRLEIELTLS